jgi:3-deoxy-D-manno-octulosonic-acid transferase
MFRLFYYILATILYIVAIPYLLFLRTKNRYKDSIPARFFLTNNPKFENKSIWFHSCSLGETKALKPIVKKLNTDVNISVVTNTGFAEAKEITKNVRYLPFEILLPYWMTEQKALVVMEAELWYMLFLYAKIKKTPTVLINARISDRSYPKYKKMSFFYKKIFENIDYVYAQSTKDADRLKELGAKNIKVSGNIKIATDIKPSIEYQKPSINQIITAGSTHDGEEELIIDSFLEYKKENKNSTLIVVPRHPDRFDDIDELIKSKIDNKELLYHRFADSAHFDSDIVLVDKLGELVNIYAISDVVILGGSLFTHLGGHNPIEPATFGCKIISGKSYFNQYPLYSIVENIKEVSTDELTDALNSINDISPSYISQKPDVSDIIDKIRSF